MVLICCLYGFILLKITYLDIIPTAVEFYACAEFALCPGTIAVERAGAGVATGIICCGSCLLIEFQVSDRAGSPFVQGTDFGGGEGAVVDADFVEGAREIQIIVFT